jgi:SAM-dependent methyltransferase
MNANHSPHKETWASGTVYESYVGRWSRLIAFEFVHWLGVPAGSHWLDVGCGTGALSQTILDLAAPGQITGIDRSADFVAYAREHVRDERAQFEVGDAQSLAAETNSYGAAVSALMLNFIPEPRRAVTEMARAVKPAGVVAAYVWDYAGKMQFMRHFWNAAAALDPAALDLDEGRRFPLCQPQPLRDLFQSAGLQDVEVRPIEIATDFQDFDDFWQPFLGGQGPAPGHVSSLTDEQRIALRERIKAGLPFALDGSIPLVARAWAVRGIRP